MNKKQEVKERISAAEKACSKVQGAWNAAYDTLYGGVAINGYGIYLDKGADVYRRLSEVQEHIQIALKTLDSINWPTPADYDCL